MSSSHHESKAHMRSKSQHRGWFQTRLHHNADDDVALPHTTNPKPKACTLPTTTLSCPAHPGGRPRAASRGVVVHYMPREHDGGAPGREAVVVRPSSLAPGPGLAARGGRLARLPLASRSSGGFKLHIDQGPSEVALGVRALSPRCQFASMQSRRRPARSGGAPRSFLSR